MQTAEARRWFSVEAGASPALHYRYPAHGFTLRSQSVISSK
jgi:hypothetical protein